MTKSKLEGKRPYQRTTVKLAPLTVDEVLAALLKTPPPKAKEKPKKQPTKRRHGGKHEG